VGQRSLGKPRNAWPRSANSDSTVVIAADIEADAAHALEIALEALSDHGSWAPAPGRVP